MRVETDLIGTKEIDQDAYYGLQTLRAYENFNITGRRAHPEFIRSLAAVKKGCGHYQLPDWRAVRREKGRNCAGL